MADKSISYSLPQKLSSWPELFASNQKPRPLIMGILNVTPDSFADHGAHFEPAVALAHARDLVAAGADILDVGGESTRPFAEPVPLEEELRRVIPVIAAIAPEIPIPISIDTYKAPVARAALNAGASIINDISALRFDPDMAPLAAARRVPVVLMHMQGTPRDMQRDPHYGDLMGEITAFFRERLEFALSRGLALDSIALDPGLGFGKNREHNLEILRRLELFLELGCPLVVGPFPQGLYRPSHRPAGRPGAGRGHPGGAVGRGAGRRPNHPHPQRGLRSTISCGLGGDFSD